MYRSDMATVFAILVAILAATPDAAAAYPERPIRIIIPFPPGGGTDNLLRLMQPNFEAALGAPIVIDNRSGAGGTVGNALAARAAPDGYTLMLSSASFTYSPHLYKKLPYDAVKDFRPITNLAQSPLVLSVHPSLPVKSIKELIALARARPGEIHYSASGVGSNIHMTGELFKYLAKIDLQMVPYKGGGPAAVALITGEVQVTFVGILGAVAHMKAGRIRGLAVTSNTRTPAAPQIPTIDEAGVPGYNKSGWSGLFSPAGVPDAIIDHVYNAIASVMKNPDTIKYLATQGSVAVANTPADFAAFVRAELAEWGKLIEKMNLKL